MKLRVNGSERIQDQAEKLKRIQELAGIKKSVVTESTGTLETTLHSVDAADGNNYGLVQEGAHVFIKKLVGENYEYINGLKNKTDHKYSSLAEGLRHLNIMVKDINVATGNLEGTDILKKK